MSQISDQRHDSQISPPENRGAQQSKLVLILLALVGVLLFQNLDRSRSVDGPLQVRTITPRGELGADEQATVELFENLKNSTVFIQTRQLNLEARLGYRFSVEEIPAGIGTGFVWDQSGHIVTNFHVVQKSAGASVQLADESVYDAKLVGVAPEQDLAILKIDAPADKLQPIPVGSSHDLKVGQTVIALGYPLGLNLTLTKGVISGLDQSLPLQDGSEIHKAIQTDASINPGNSGGPLLDSAGRLIGVNTAILKAPAGFGFAIPVDTVRDAVGRMAENPLQILPTLGIRLEKTLATVTNIETGERRRLGLRIQLVYPGGPAEKAGLRGMGLSHWGEVISGDIIMAIDDELIDRPTEIDEIMAEHQAGDRVVLTILRENQALEVPITLQ